MTRTTRYKLTYFASLVILALIAGLVIVSLGGGTVVVTGVALIFFIPGRIQGYFYRDLFAGRRLLDAGKPEQAIPYLERFIKSIQQYPRHANLLWLSGTIYTPNVLAMATNNVGVARLELGQVNEAEQAFNSAVAKDPFYPLPHFNMAIVHELRGDRSEAAEAVRRAHQLGYTGGTLDKVIHKGQLLLALAEGRSSSV